MSEEVWTNETEIIRRDEAGNVRRFVRVGLLEQAQQDNAHLRSLLQAWVRNERGPIEFDQCVYCQRFEWDGDHADDCPWLLAKQYLEAHNE